MRPLIKRGAGLVAALTVTLIVNRPAAADDPKFEYAKPPEKPVGSVTWKVSAQAGLVLTTGNSETTTLSGGLDSARQEGNNKLQLQLGGAYVRSSLFTFIDANGDMMVGPGELTRSSVTTAKGFLGKARYDRFLTEKNSLYVVAALGADVPAGKDLFGGGQVGYSRLLLKTAKHEVTVEAGYDFTYEDLTASDEGVSIHSARFFAGYAGTITKDTGLAASVETQLNLNEENAPYLADGKVAPFEDTRVNGKLGLTTKLLEDISIRFGFGLRFDNAPAPQPAFPTAPYVAGFNPLAEKLDTTTEISIIVNFL